MIIKITRIALIVPAVALLLFSSWFSFEFYTARKILPGNILYEIEPGKSVRTIAQNLRGKGIIKKELPFILGYKIFFPSKSIKAGEYAFHLPLSIKDVLIIITEGKVYLHPLTIPEGMTRREIALYLESHHFSEAKDFLEAALRTEAISGLDKDASNLEGYLFPETYRFPKGTPAEKIVSTLVAQFKSAFNENWLKRASEIKMTPREVVTLASLIEKEASLPEERKLVSAVFHNRLRIGMKLDCDPTIIYALKEKGISKERLQSKDLKIDSPYNTYLYRGLPPGPICNPGRESLEAALYPLNENYLYFVSKNDGSHHFSRTFREHQKAVIKYQKSENRKKDVSEAKIAVEKKS
jgi:UPF0755 protein